VKTALKLAAANPYVNMFVWFIFRDSTSSTWFSGLQQSSGKKKPAYNAFKTTAHGIVGQSQTVTAGKKFSVKIPVPILSYYNSPGAKIGVTYKVLIGKTLYAIGQPLERMAKDGTITVKVNFAPAKKKSYTLNVVASDRGGRFESTNVLLSPS
jgi:hypothetical protein